MWRLHLLQTIREHRPASISRPIIRLRRQMVSQEANVSSHNITGIAVGFRRRLFIAR